MTGRTAAPRLTRRLPRWLFAAPEWIFRARLGVLVPWWLMLVTTGRRSGLRRRVVLDVVRRDGRDMWVVAADGRRADWVRNVIAQPRVEVWHRGRRDPATAVLPGDVDPVAFAVDLYRRRPAYLRAIYRLLGERLRSEADVRRLAAGTQPVLLRRDAAGTTGGV